MLSQAKIVVSIHSHIHPSAWYKVKRKGLREQESLLLAQPPFHISLKGSATRFDVELDRLDHILR